MSRDVIERMIEQHIGGPHHPLATVCRAILKRHNAALVRAVKRLKSQYDWEMTGNVLEGGMESVIETRGKIACLEDVLALLAARKGRK